MRCVHSDTFVALCDLCLARARSSLTLAPEWLRLCSTFSLLNRRRLMPWYGELVTLHR